MRIAIFSAQDFEREFFKTANKSFDHELVYFDERLHQQSAELAAGFPAVCAFITDQLDGPTLSRLAASGTRLVSLRSAGYNHVDLDAAARLGLTVLRIPAYSPHAIAEHAVGLMLTLNRHLHRAYNRVREGNFELDGLIGFDMHGKTVGIVGTGMIGAALAQIMRGFGCTLLGHDIVRNTACVELGVKYVSLEQLLRESDIVSLHCPLTAETEHLINSQTIALMKRGSMLINTARGALIDTRAAINALKSRNHFWYLGIDVYEEEGPLFFEDRSSTIIQDDVFQRLTTFPNVVITGHQAYLTRDALTKITEVSLANVRDFEAGTIKRENLVCPDPRG
jgi:D-lactate dehydrogenase